MLDLEPSDDETDEEPPGDGHFGRAENTLRQRYLVPGLRLRLSDLTDTLGGYACEVQHVDDRSVWVTLPMRRDGMLSLGAGQLVSVRFDRPDDAAYLFDSVVTDRTDDDNAPFCIARPVTINRRPRRASPRVALVVPATLEAVASPKRTREPGTVVDLSARGVGLVGHRPLEIGEQLRVRCDIPDVPALRIDETATVRSCSLYGRTPSGAVLHHHGLRFDEATDETRERILDTIIRNLTAEPSSD